MRKPQVIVLLLLILAIANIANGRASDRDDLRQLVGWDCESAVSDYNNAVSEIDSYVRRYVNCVSGSQGQDDCSSEFRRLKNAQSDFKSAVSDYQSYCR